MPLYPVSVSVPSGQSVHISFSPGPLQPKPTAPPSSGGGGGGGGNPKKADYIGLYVEGDQTLLARRFGRHKISDRPGAVVAARLEIQYVDKALPTGNVALSQVEDFATLDPSDWGIADVLAITSSALTTATDAGRLTIDVTAAYNAAKVAGRSIFAWKLQYEFEDEDVGLGRWYRIGSTGDVAPVLVLTVTAGKDLRLELLATPVLANVNHVDDEGKRAAVITAGDGDVYPPLGNGVPLGATINGLIDDGIGSLTGTPFAPIVRGPDILLFAWLSVEEGLGLTADEVDVPAFVTARTRLGDWFALKGGFTDQRDVRDWATSILRCCRSIAYQDHLGRETLSTEPVGGTGDEAVRTVGPNEHGLLRLYPIPGAQDSQYPISRVDVSYGWDHLGVAGWQGHAVLDKDETTPPDAQRAAEAADAFARYGRRELGNVAAASQEGTGYEWVPMDEPGIPTGVRIRNLLWDRAKRRRGAVQGLEVELPRFALAWPLMAEFYLVSPLLPSAAARRLLTSQPYQASTGTWDQGYAARRVRCTVRGLPRLLAEHGDAHPVLVTAQIEAWDSP